jgi:hypothetical protein
MGRWSGRRRRWRHDRRPGRRTRHGVLHPRRPIEPPLDHQRANGGMRRRKIRHQFAIIPGLENPPDYGNRKPPLAVPPASDPGGAATRAAQQGQVMPRDGARRCRSNCQEVPPAVGMAPTARSPSAPCEPRLRSDGSLRDMGGQQPIDTSARHARVTESSANVALPRPVLQRSLAATAAAAPRGSSPAPTGCT